MRRLNDVSSRLHLKVLRRSRFEMVLQVLFNYIASHLSSWPTKISYRPHVPTPVALLDMLEIIKQLGLCYSIDFLHNFTDDNLWRSAYQYIYMDI